MAVYPKPGTTKFMASHGAGPTRVRKTFNTEAAAHAWEAVQDAVKAAVLARPAPIPEPAKGWTLKDALDSTHKHQWKGTGGEYKALLNARQALAFFGEDTLLSEITAKWIVEWMDELEELGNSGGTRNRKLSALRTMLSRAMALGELQAMPYMARKSEAEHRMVRFSDADEAAMLEKATYLGLFDLADFIKIGLDTGFRLSELLHLRMSDYGNGMLELHEGATKTGEGRSVPCTPRVKAILEKRIADGQSRVFPTLTPSSLRKQWDVLRYQLGKADDPGFIIHAMRHTCATRLVAEGVPIHTVMVWMGHLVIQTTLRYVRHDKSALNRPASYYLSVGSRHRLKIPKKPKGVTLELVMTPSITFWLLLMFQPDNTVQLVGTHKTEEACLTTLATAPPTAVAFCVPSKATPPKKM